MKITRRGLLGSFGIFGAGAEGAGAEIAYPPEGIEPYDSYSGGCAQVAGVLSRFVLRIGSGPQFVARSKGGDNAKPGIGHFCMTIENFNVEQMLKALADYGVKARVRKRDDGTGDLYFTDADGIPPELYFIDPDGILLQLQDVSYCGGAGYLGEECPVPA